MYLFIFSFLSLDLSIFSKPTFDFRTLVVTKIVYISFKCHLLVKVENDSLLYNDHLALLMTWLPFGNEMVP